MDEVHYLGDRFRGAVWEEVLIHLPDSVDCVALSATVSNAEEFGAWLVTVRGDTRVIVDEQRPVPLWQHVLVGTRLFDLFRTLTRRATEGEPADVNPELREDASRRAAGRRNAGTRPRGAHRAGARAQRTDRGTRLESRGPAAAHHLHLQPRRVRRGRAPVRVRGAVADQPAEERDEITSALVARLERPARTSRCSATREWLDGLRRGVAAHHAGLLPAFKEMVEELFVRGLVRAVFATETLALGINMPARSVLSSG